MHVGDTENKENNGMCVSFSICRDNRMRKHISCSVDFMSHRKYNRISIRKNDFTKKNFQRRCSPKSRTSSSITCPCEIQYFKYVAVSGCCHFHGSSSCKFIAPTYRIDPAKAAWNQRHNSSRDLNPPNTCKMASENWWKGRVLGQLHVFSPRTCPSDDVQGPLKIWAAKKGVIKHHHRIIHIKRYFSISWCVVRYLLGCSIPKIKERRNYTEWQARTVLT